MDKTLKIFVLLQFAFSFFTMSVAQTWRTFTPNDFGITYFSFQQGGTSEPDQTFKISKYTNDIWLSRDSNAIKINNFGQAELFNSDNFPILSSVYAFNAIAITPTKVVFADDAHGIFSYNGSSWSALSGGLGTVTMSSDADTIWCSKDGGQNYLKITPISTEIGPVGYYHRYISKNGVYWGTGSPTSGFLFKLNGTTPIFYYANQSALLDDQNYHIKFSNYSDTMYTSGDIGISMAVGDVFVDSICAANSSNMPNLPIVEFEIDENHNIWAVFGNTSIIHSPVKIGFYDRSLKAWTQFYDGTNSPITFSGTVSIELDTLGNLWVSNWTKLHCLSFSNPPSWLGLKELDKQEGNFSVYPNPSNGDIHISSKNNMLIEKVTLLDAGGKVVQEFSSSPTLHLDVEAGAYFLKIVGENNFEEVLPFVLN
jgi:hypothetical protein